MPVPEGEQVREYAPFDVEQFRPDLKRDLGSSPDVATLFDEQGEPLPTFDMRHADAFNGLTFLGAMTSRFSWLGHDFVIRTLTQDELLQPPLLIKEWQGTVGEPKAYTTAMAAMCIVTIDGNELPIPLGNQPGRQNVDLAWAQLRFDYARKNWFQFTIDRIYSEYLDLENKVSEVIQAMGEAYGPTESTPGLNANSVGPSDEDSSPATD